MRLLIFVSFELLGKQGKTGSGDTTVIVTLDQPEDFNKTIQRIREDILKGCKGQPVTGVTLTHMHTIKWED